MARSRIRGVSFRITVLTIVAVLAIPLARAEAREWCARVQDQVLLDLLKRGMQRSFTFRSLVAALERSDIVVHLRRTEEPNANTGFTQFIAARGGSRFVRITLNVAEASEFSVALLGHELQHAVELAGEPLVVDARAYEALYRSIGRESCTPQSPCFDTPAAVDAGRRVLKELRG